MKRRVIAALLTLTMVFSLTACGGSKSDSTGGQKNASASAAADDG